MDEVMTSVAAGAAAGAAYGHKHRKEIGRVMGVATVVIFSLLFRAVKEFTLLIYVILRRFWRFFLTVGILGGIAYWLYIGPASGYLEPKIEKENLSTPAFIKENVVGIWAANDGHSYEFDVDRGWLGTTGFQLPTPTIYYGHGKYFAVQDRTDPCSVVVFKLIDHNTIKEMYTQYARKSANCRDSRGGDNYAVQEMLPGRIYTRFAERGAYFALIKPQILASVARQRKNNGDNRALSGSLETTLKTLATWEKTHR